jgi:hypothetical protein
MRFKSVRQVEKLNKRKVITHSIIQFALTLFLLYSSFFIIGIPIEFIFPYLIVFGVVIYLANKYSDKSLRFYKNSKGIIFVDLGWFSNFYYILATVTCIIITSLGLILRVGLLEKIGMDSELTFFFFGESMSIFILVTIIFDFLLIYGKAVLAGMHRRVLSHYKLILSGKEEVKEETK